jgi:hypothetical protein
MKKLYLLPLFLTSLTVQVQAQSVLSSLTQHQKTLKSPSSQGGGSSSSTGSSGVSGTSSSTSVATGRCDQDDQSSMPLALLTALIQEKDGGLEISHDPRSGTLTVSSADMISNCSSMLDWNLRQQEINGKHVYAVEVKFKPGSDCKEEGCRYRVAKVENGNFKEYQVVTLKPDLKGFETCLEKSGVISGGKVQPNAIYSTPVRERFENVNTSGSVTFVSSGPVTPMVKARYGNFEFINGCDHFEKINQNPIVLLSKDDEEKQRLDAEASKLKDCDINEYYKVADFLEKYESYADELGAVRDRLIMEAAKKSAQAISENKYTDEDLKVVADFERYIVRPRVEKATALYEETLNLEGDQKRLKQEELKKVLAEIVALNSKPYFVSGHVTKLIADGRFEEAEQINSVKLLLASHARLGARENNVVITPQVAMSRFLLGQQQFSQGLEQERQRYEIRTGQSSGHAQYWASLASRMRHNIEARTENYRQEIQNEYTRVQPGGYCYRYFRNTQRCIQDSMQRIQELQAYLEHYNKVDAERAEEYDVKAQEYAKLEAEGRRYIATQNGEVAEEATPVVADNNLHPTPRMDNSTYNFDYPGGGQGQGQGQGQGPGQQMNPQMWQQQPMALGQQMPHMFQQPNPYAMYQQGNMGYNYNPPHMGQQAFGMQGQFNPWMSGFGGGGGMGGNSYSFNWNGGGGGQMGGQMGGWGQQQPGWGQQQPGWGQQQQSGFWGQPYQAYNNYNMWGR